MVTEPGALATGSYTLLNFRSVIQTEDYVLNAGKHQLPSMRLSVQEPFATLQSLGLALRLSSALSRLQTAFPKGY